MPPVSKPKKPRLTPGTLTNTEEKILRAVNDLHLVDAEAITRLLSANTARSHYSKLLTKLAGGADYKLTSYLYRFRMPHAPGNFRRLYTLTRRGATLLRELGVDADWWYRPRQASHYSSFSYLTHQLSITKFLVSIAAFVRASPAYELVGMRTCYALERNPPTLTRDASAHEIPTTVLPDAFVQIDYNGAGEAAPECFDLWIEIDAGTESISKFQQLILNRIKLVRDKQYEEYFGTPSILLCYLTVGPTMDYRLSRLHTLRKWTAAVLSEQALDDWASVFKFSTIDEYVYDTLMLFTDPVWYQPYSDTLVPLFPTFP